MTETVFIYEGQGNLETRIGNELKLSPMSLTVKIEIFIYLE